MKCLNVALIILVVSCNVFGGERIVKYRASNGMEFDTEKECSDYENNKKTINEILALIKYVPERHGSECYSIHSSLEILLLALSRINKTINIIDIGGEK